jgi:hypothetical protein
MRNNRSARRQFGKSPPWQIWCERTYDGLVNRRQQMLFESATETLIFVGDVMAHVLGRMVH